jgi:hypothetical protein
MSSETRAGERGRDPSLVISHKLLGPLEWFVVHHRRPACARLRRDSGRPDGRPLAPDHGVLRVRIAGGVDRG